MRLAIPELAGYGPAVLDEVLTAALADAGDDDRLVAKVLLQRARIALMESRPVLAEGRPNGRSACSSGPRTATTSRWG